MKKVKVVVCWIILVIVYLYTLLFLLIFSINFVKENWVQNLLNEKLSEYNTRLSIGKIYTELLCTGFIIKVNSINIETNKLKIKTKSLIAGLTPFKIHITIINPEILIKKFSPKTKAHISKPYKYLTLLKFTDEVKLINGKINYDKIQININGQYRASTQKGFLKIKLNKSVYSLTFHDLKEKILINLVCYKFNPSLIAQLKKYFLTPTGTSGTIFVLCTLSKKDFKIITATGSLYLPSVILKKDHKNLSILNLRLSFNIIKRSETYSLLTYLVSEKPAAFINICITKIPNNLTLKSNINRTSIEDIKKIWQWISFKTYMKVFKIYKKGILKNIEVTYSGTTEKIELLLKNLKIKVNFLNSTVKIPKIKNLILTNIKGSILYYNNNLKLINVSGSISPNSRVTLLNGTISFRNNVKLNLKANFISDFKSIEPILKENLKDRLNIFYKKISKIKGNFCGNFSLTKNKDFNFILNLNSLNIEVLPFNLDSYINLKGKEVTYEINRALEIKKLKISYRDSEIKGHFKLSLNRHNFLNFLIFINHSIINLSDINAFPLTKLYFESTNGRLILKDFELSGNLKNLKLKHFKTNLSLKDGNFKLKSFAESVKVLTLDAYLDDSLLKIKNASISLLNSSINLKGTLKNYLSHEKSISLVADGSISQRAINFIHSKFHFPDWLNLNPFRLKNLHIHYDYRSKFKLFGKATFSKKVFVKFSYSTKSMKLKIFKQNPKKNLLKSSMEFSVKNDNLQVKISGNLDREIFDSIFNERITLEKEIKTNLKFCISLKPLYVTSLEGILKIKKLKFLIDKNLFMISEFGLNSQNNIINFNGDININKSKIIISKGIWNLEKNDIKVDAHSNFIDFNELNLLFNKNKSSKKLQFKKLNSITIRFKAKKLLYKNQNFCLCDSILTYNNKNFSIKFKNINYCNLPLQGKIDFKHNLASFSSIAKNIDFYKFLSCITKKEFITGKMNIEFKVKTSLQKDFYNNLKGKVQLKLKEGRIYKLNILMKLFALLNTTEIFFGKVPDLQKKGMGYNEVYISSVLKGKTLKIDRGIINGKSIEIFFNGTCDLLTHKINMVLFVCPLKSIDRILKYIPLINKITGGNLVSIPFQIVGRYDKPIIIPLSPKAVSSQILRLFKRTIKAPFLIFQPFKQ